MNSRIEAFNKSHRAIPNIDMCKHDGDSKSHGQDASVDPSMLSRSPDAQSPPGSVPPEVNTTAASQGEATDHSRPWANRLIDFYWANEFLILIVVVILLARAYPPLGAEYLYPQITATWIAVVFIFSKLTNGREEMYSEELTNGIWKLTLG